MKGIVAYDSVYGNTKQVAEVIAEQIRSEGHQVELIALRNGGGGAVAGDFLFVGSPTRIGRMTRETKAFLESLDVEHWEDRPVVAFDTVGPFSKDAEKREIWLNRVEKSAATRMQELASERGLKAYPEALHIAVTGMKGPLAPDALERAREFVLRFLATVK